MDAAAELGRNPIRKHQIQPEYGDEQAARDGTAEPVSKDQILRHERGQENIHFLCSADHVQDWQPYPVDPYSCCMCGHTSLEGEPGPTPAGKTLPHSYPETGFRRERARGLESNRIYK